MVSASIKLGPENTRSGYRPEDAEVEYENQLVGNGHAGHLLCSHLTYHNVVQKAHKVCDSVLYHDRNHHCKNHPVKPFVPNILFHFFLPFLLSFVFLRQYF